MKPSARLLGAWGLLWLVTARVAGAPSTSDPKAIGVGPAGAPSNVIVPGKRWAIVIGINDYVDPKIPDLRYAENDARAVYQVLVHPDYGAFPKDGVRLLLGKADAGLNAERAAARNIRAAMNWLQTQAGKDDLVIIANYGLLDEEEHTSHPKLIYVDEANRIIKVKS